MVSRFLWRVERVADRAVVAEFLVWEWVRVLGPWA